MASPKVKVTEGERGEHEQKYECEGEEIRVQSSVSFSVLAFCTFFLSVNAATAALKSAASAYR